MSFMWPLLFRPVFFQTALPCIFGYYLEKGVMPLDDVVMLNCKKGTTTENQDTDVKYMGKALYVGDCVCII